MSPPDTNLETQKRRHRGPLIGMGLVVVLAVGLILFWIAGLFDTEAADNTEMPAGESEAIISDENAPIVGPSDEDVEIEVSE